MGKLRLGIATHLYETEKHPVSEIRPASYAVNAGDLKAMTPGNHLVKFADGTYLIVPSNNVGSWSPEMNNIETWAATNNLALTHAK